jgi:hypothetical protein
MTPTFPLCWRSNTRLSSKNGIQGKVGDHILPAKGNDDDDDDDDDNDDDDDYDDNDE